MSDIYPLSWPIQWPRTKTRERSKFSSSRTFAAAERELTNQLMLVGASGILVSSNMIRDREPADPGVAAYFDLADAEKKKQPRVLACDRWKRTPDNVWAISLHVEALRGQDRWGVGSIAQAFAGYTAIASSASGEPPYKELGLLAPPATEEEVERAFKVMARLRHPDAGGSHEAWLRLQTAREQALAQVQS